MVFQTNLAPSNAYQDLRQAIANRQAVRVRYKGYDRDICPHTIGTKNGREKVLTYQFAGGSSSGLPSDGEWRCMFIDQIESVVAIEADWHTDTRHSQPQTCVDVIDLETE